VSFETEVRRLFLVGGSFALMKTALARRSVPRPSPHYVISLWWDVTRRAGRSPFRVLASATYPFAVRNEGVAADSSGRLERFHFSYAEHREDA
jgi:hypothetical protein